MKLKQTSNLREVIPAELLDTSRCSQTFRATVNKKTEVPDGSLSNFRKTPKKRSKSQRLEKDRKKSIQLIKENERGNMYVKCLLDLNKIKKDKFNKIQL